MVGIKMVIQFGKRSISVDAAPICLTLIISEQERQQSSFHFSTLPVTLANWKKPTSGNTERPCQPPSQPSINSKLAIVSKEHTVQPDRSRQTQIPCQRPSHPSNPDPHQGPGPGPRPRPSARQTPRKRDNEQKQERERERETGGKMGPHFTLFTQIRVLRRRLSRNNGEVNLSQLRANLDATSI